MVNHREIIKILYLPTFSIRVVHTKSVITVVIVVRFPFVCMWTYTYSSNKLMLNLGSKTFVQNCNLYVLASQNSYRTIFSRNKIVKTLK